MAELSQSTKMELYTPVGLGVYIDISNLIPNEQASKTQLSITGIAPAKTIPVSLFRKLLLRICPEVSLLIAFMPAHKSTKDTLLTSMGELAFTT
jgi:hypothetical protein